MPTALLVGPRSMLGGRIAEQLRRAGWRVVTAGRSQDCDVPLDLRSPEPPCFSLPCEADALFHCASAFGDDSSEGQWLNERVNSLGAHHVVALAQAAQCRHVVYAGSTSSCFTHSPLELGSYGASKARGEEVLRWGLDRAGVGFASLRLSQLYDERGECIRHQLWFGRIVAYASLGKVLRMPGGESLRNFVHVEDAARAMIAAGEQRFNGVGNLVHPSSESYRSIAERAYEVFARGGRIEVAPEKQPFRAVLIPAMSAEIQALDTLPFVKMRDGLARIRDAGQTANFGPVDVD